MMLEFSWSNFVILQLDQPQYRRLSQLCLEEAWNGRPWSRYTSNCLVLGLIPAIILFIVGHLWKITIFEDLAPVAWGGGLLVALYYSLSYYPLKIAKRFIASQVNFHDFNKQLCPYFPCLVSNATLRIVRSCVAPRLVRLNPAFVYLLSGSGMAIAALLLDVGGISMWSLWISGFLCCSFLFAIILTANVLQYFRALHRLDMEQCPRCGYELRESVHPSDSEWPPPKCYDCGLNTPLIGSLLVGVVALSLRNSEINMDEGFER